VLEDIKYLVLQGGGIRCAWQAGFVAALEGERPIRPHAISAVSASSAVACAIVCRRLEFAVNCFKAAIESNKKNIYLTRLLRGDRVFPQAEIYRNTLLQVFDQAALEELYAGPDIQVLVTRTSAKLPRYPGLVIGLALYALQALRTRRGYRRFEAQFGFSGEFVPVKKCATPAELADLVLASSCTPPVTPWYSLHGRPVLDGSLCESVPLRGLPEKQGKTLVLLTTKGTTVDRSPGILYAEPSQDLRIASWDYTDASKLDYLYALGKKDGSAFLETTETPQTFING
jgi:predicted patatin/cPLA2 family phospholipase